MTTRAKRGAGRKRKAPALQRLGVFKGSVLVTFVSVFVIMGMSLVMASNAATVAPMPFGLFQSANNLAYSFPKTPRYAIQYYGWNEGFQTADAKAAWAKGTEPFVELQTCGNPCNAATSVSLASVTAGDSDAYLRSFATSLKAFNHPVLLTFDHEMNGDWYPWGDTEVTPAQWIAAWQHVIRVMRSVTGNFTTVWAPNIQSGAVAVSNYWPGKGYPAARVDDIGLDGYYQNTGSTWANTFAASIAAIKKVGGSRTLLITETGVPAADSNDVSQIDNLMSGARGAGVKGVMYFDAGNWTFTSAGQAAFESNVN